MFKFKVFLTATVLAFGFFLFSAPPASAVSMSIGNPVKIFNLWKEVRKSATRTYLKVKESSGSAPVSSAERERQEAEINRLKALIKKLDALSARFSEIAGANKKNKITVIYPNGGESFQCGKKYDILWKAEFGGNKTGVSELSSPAFGIILSGTDEFGGSYAVRTVARNLKLNPGKNGTYSYSWEVPCSINTGSYAIRVVANPGLKVLAFEDSSDKPFKLIGQESSRPDIKVVFPAKGSVLKLGNKYEIKWTSKNLSDKVSISLRKPMEPNFSYVVAWGVPNSGSLTVDTGLWKESVAPGDYVLRISDDNNPMYGKFYGNSFEFSVSK